MILQDLTPIPLPADRGPIDQYHLKPGTLYTAEPQALSWGKKMIQIILWGLALAFAIPTFGLSLLACYLFFQWVYKLAAAPIVEAMHNSLIAGEVVELKATNPAVIKKAFKLLRVEDFEVEYYPSFSLRAFTGMVDHPRHANPLLVQVHLVTGENRMTLQATEPQASSAVVKMTEMFERITKEVQEKRADESTKLHP